MTTPGSGDDFLRSLLQDSETDSEPGSPAAAPTKSTAGATGLAALKRAYKTLYKSGLSLADAQAAIAAEAETQPELKLLAEFLASAGRGIVR